MLITTRLIDREIDKQTVKREKDKEREVETERLNTTQLIDIHTYKQISKQKYKRGVTSLQGPVFRKVVYFNQELRLC